MSKYELLAPAKNFECGICAINAGADAVYIGGPAFGAREDAGNNLEDIDNLVQYAHTFNAKIYVTVNTLLYEKEIAEAKSLIEKLYALRVDGIIIQDPAILELDLPPIQIIASTQMHNISSEKINFYKEIGIKRFILPRESSLEFIQKVKTETNAELEAFIHGALCVSYSGRCYLSFAIGGRSANRGACAQPCRKAYSLYDTKGKLMKKNKYFLSLKDLCLENKLEELIDAGVTSFKIEGRLKNKEYVTNTVSYYRQKLDQILEKKELKKSSSGIIVTNFTPNLSKSFNRGFTEFFINNNRNSKENPVASIHTPKMVGEKIGKVKEIKGKKVTFFDKHIPQIHSGDGVCYFDKYDILRGTTVNKVFDNSIELNEIKQIFENTTTLYRNNDFEYNKTLKQANFKRLIQTTITINKSEKGILFTAVDEDNFKVDLLYTEERETANDRDKAIENITKQLSKEGESYFKASNIKINCDPIPFFPMSILNNIRRELYKKLEDLRYRSYIVPKSEILQTETPYIKDTLPYEENVINSLSKEFFTFHQVKEIEDGPETRIDMVGKQVMSTKYCIRCQIGMCNEDKTLNTPLYLVDEEKNQLKCTFACDRCGMNIIFQKRGGENK